MTTSRTNIYSELLPQSPRPAWAYWGSAPPVEPSVGLATPLANVFENSALNLLDGQLRRHHPVMVALRPRAYKLEWDNLVRQRLPALAL